MTRSYTPLIQRQRDRKSNKNTGYGPASKLIFLSVIEELICWGFIPVAWEGNIQPPLEPDG